MFILLFKTIVIWCIIVMLAVINAALREKLLNSVFGPGVALPVSGLILSSVVFLVAYVSIPIFQLIFAQNF